MQPLENIKVDVDGKETPVTAPSVLLTPAGTKHCITNVGASEVRIVFLFPAIEMEHLVPDLHGVSFCPSLLIPL